MSYKDPQYQEKYRKKYRELNKTKLQQKDWERYHLTEYGNKAKIKQKEYRVLNKELIKTKDHARRLKTIKQRSITGKEYRQSHREQIRAYYKIKRLNDSNYRIRSSLSSRLCGLLRKEGLIKQESIIKLIGCTLEELKIYLESKFQIGMSWDNYGRKGWHIDHIIPCANFNLTAIEEQKKCFHYTNFQPLWWKDNLAKGAKICGGVGNV